MRFDVVTLFREMVEHAAGFGVIGRARERGLWQLGTWNPRDFATDNYRTVDDRPYGGGPGMVMLGEPLAAALGAARAAQREAGYERSWTIHLSPSGRPLTHARVAALTADADRVAYAVVASRYEGIDERWLAREVDEEIAVGDFVVSGGELPALMLMDAMVRLRARRAERCRVGRPGLVCCRTARLPALHAARERPRRAVPDVLLSGNHAAIRRWRLKQALGRTWLRRPELLAARTLTKEEEALLAEFRREAQAAAQQ